VPGECLRLQMGVTILSRRNVYISGSLILIFAGVICQLESIGAADIGIILNGAGVAIGVVQFFSPRQAEETPATGSGQAIDAPPPGPPARPPELPPPSRVYPAAFFLAAVLLTATSVLGLAMINSIGLRPPFSSRTDFMYHLLALLPGIVAPVGYLGFSLRLSGNARRFGIAATIFVITGFIVGDVAQFSYLINYVSGANVPAPAFTIFEYEAIAAIVANIFLAIAVDRSDIYPKWIAWMCLANMMAEVFYIVAHLNWIVLDANSAGNLVLASAYVTIGACLLRRAPSRRGPAPHGAAARPGRPG